MRAAKVPSWTKGLDATMMHFLKNVTEVNMNLHPIHWHNRFVVEG